MTTEREQYLLDRCLRLEHALLVARGMDIAPLLPQVARRGLYAAPLSSPPLAHIARRIYHNATEAEIVQMRALRARGLSYAAIAREMPYCATTIRDHVHDVLIEREVAA